MAINSANRRTVLWKTEAVNGTEQTISASTDAVLVTENKNPVQIDTTLITTQNLRNSYSPFPNGIGRQLFPFTPKCFLMTAAKAGSSTAVGTPSFLGAAIKACGFREMISASASVTYTPLSDPNDTNLDSMTAHVYVQELQHRLKNVFGTFTLEEVAGQMPTLTFDMKGLYATDPIPFNISAQSITYPTDNKEMVQNLGLSIGGYTTPVVRSLRLTMGVQIPENADVNSPNGLKSIEIMGRQPMLNLVLAVDNTSSQIGGGNFNPYTDYNTSTLRAISWTHGSATGKKVQVSLPACQINKLAYEERDNFTLWNLDYLPTSATDDGEITIVFK